MLNRVFREGLPSQLHLRKSKKETKSISKDSLRIGTLISILTFLIQPPSIFYHALKQNFLTDNLA